MRPTVRGAQDSYMKVSKNVIGKVVEVTWMDPNWDRVVTLAEMKKGREALATWKEYGVAYDLTDGVLLIAHSLASQAGKPHPPGHTDEVCRSAIPEVLIESLVVYEPVKETA